MLIRLSQHRSTKTILNIFRFPFLSYIHSLAVPHNFAYSMAINFKEKSNRTSLQINSTKSGQSHFLCISVMDMQMSFPPACGLSSAFEISPVVVKTWNNLACDVVSVFWCLCGCFFLAKLASYQTVINCTYRYIKLWILFINPELLYPLLLDNDHLLGSRKNLLPLTVPLLNCVGAC